MGNLQHGPSHCYDGDEIMFWDPCIIAGDNSASTTPVKVEEAFFSEEQHSFFISPLKASSVVCSGSFRAQQTVTDA